MMMIAAMMLMMTLTIIIMLISIQTVVNAMTSISILKSNNHIIIDKIKNIIMITILMA